jgi:NADH-quinone oxidoreductase subunit M
MLTLGLLGFPLIFGLIILFLKKPEIIKWLALVVSLIELAVTLFVLVTGYGSSLTKYELNIPWIPQLGVNFHIAMDGISVLMVFLTNLLIPFIILAGFKRDQTRVNILYFLILLMQTALIGVFIALNAFLFYIFWELALIPAYFIILIWGGEKRQIITLKFFIYTLIGSLLMLVAFIFIYFQTENNSFELSAFYGVHICPCQQQWLFWLLFLAFAIKMPIFPLHTWQPDTYTTASTQGVMLISGIMLKMGIYGAIRWLLPVVPEGANQWTLVVMGLSIIGIIYGSFIALKQKDLKTMIAYSSIAHVGLIAAGIFAKNLQSLQGTMIQMLAHGIIVIGLFYSIDIIENRLKTRQINQLGGIKLMDRTFSALFLIIVLGSIALPLTNSFVGEWLLILGIYTYNPVFGVFSGLTVIMGAVYMLYMFQKVMLGNNNSLTGTFTKITWNEKVVLIPIVILILFFGIFPQTLLDLTQGPVENILRLITLK